MKKFINKIKEKINEYGKKQLIIFIVAVILAIIIIPVTVQSIATHENPVNVIANAFESKEDKLIGKWQGEAGVTAYEFYENGKYDSYLSTFKYGGTYEINGSKLTLKNSNHSGYVVYDMSLSSDKLTLKLIEENGNKPQEKTKTTFTKVDKITMQSFSDIISELTTEKQ